MCSIIYIVSNAQIPTNGLVAYFPFNGNAKDSLVNKTNGTTHNVSFITDRMGRANSAYLFSGSSDSYNDFTGTYLINNKYTYSLWAKINSLPSTGNMASWLEA